MYLKSLEVHGFKSFANKLIFEFHNGITAIVGPNGSGKSNVADAVRWVLGEQSAKQLRGANMQDVIFAGTQMRKPMGYAYVAITINNEDHKLNVPYEEVTIARRVYRSGESEYLLNGTACRLRDIQEMLFDTGIGKEGYSIIGQGQIDKILSGKPDERRELFDEAAGIVKFKKRKATAEKNLAEEQQNMVRIEDILSELEKQVGPLQRQSEKAKEYLKLRDELRVLDVNLFLEEYDSLHTQMEQMEEKKAVAAHDLEEATADFEKTKEEYERIEAQLEEYDYALEEKRGKLTAANMSVNQQEGDVRLLQEQIHTARQEEQQYDARIAQAEDAIARCRQQRQEYRDKQKQYDGQLTGLRQEIEEAGKAVERVTSEITALELKISGCNDAMLDSMEEASSVRTEQQKYQTLLEQTNLKHAELTKRVLTNKSEAAVIQEEIDKQESILTELGGNLQGMEALQKELSTTIAHLRQETQNLEKEHGQVQQQFHMENSRLNSLKNMTERYEGFGQSIRRVMEQKSRYPGVIGVVADIIRVKKDYEIAIETALGGSIQNIVTDNEQTAKAMIQHLKKNRYGRATFLPLTNIHSKPAGRAQNVLSEPGVIGLGSTLVEAEPKYDSLVEYLLGRFVVVDHIDHALALARKFHNTLRIVTQEGELINPGGSMTGGAYRNNNNLLGRRREMDTLEETVRTLRQRLQQVDDKLAADEKELAQVRSNYEGNQKLRQEIELKQNTAKLRLVRAQDEQKKNQEQLDQIRIDSVGIDSQKDDLSKMLASLQETISAQENESQGHREQMDQLNQELEEKRVSQRSLTQKANDLQMKLNAQTQSHGFLRENLQRVEEELERYTHEKQELMQGQEQAGQKILQKHREIAETEEKIERLKQSALDWKHQIEQDMADREALNRQHKGFFDKREKLSAQMTALDKECYRLNAQQEKLSEKLDTSVNYMWEQYELTYHGAEKLKTQLELTVSEMKQQISGLKSQIRALGDVNVNAIEQFREVEERYTLLKGQHDDLIKAAEVLQGVIEELDQEMHRQFEEQFAQIRIRFDKVFRELFGGGRGTLEMVEDEDVLTAGIRIVAQPPGKKLQNMMQLSGGEKALTAIALLFAIQSLKPSPFCLLDEIEAALDDSNVGRYAEYLHKLTKDTQFIVITHRRGTMNAADILYGITMQEKGVSTLVSVNLLDDKDITD